MDSQDRFSKRPLLRREETPLQPQRGIATRDEVAIAIQVTFDGGPYPDKLLPDGTIEHIGEGRTGKQVPSRGNGAMLAAARKDRRIAVFEKVGTDLYRSLGDYYVRSHRFEPLAPATDPEWIGYIFTLEPAP